MTEYPCPDPFCEIFVPCEFCGSTEGRGTLKAKRLRQYKRWKKWKGEKPRFGYWVSGQYRKDIRQARLRRLARIFYIVGDLLAGKRQIAIIPRNGTDES